MKIEKRKQEEIKWLLKTTTTTTTTTTTKTQVDLIMIWLAVR